MYYVRVAAFVFLALATLGVFLQFVFAGLALFGATTFDLHETFGYILHIPFALLPLILALVGFRPRWSLIGLVAVFAVVLFLQPFWVYARDGTPALAALHVVFPPLLLALGLYLSWRSWQLVARERTAPAADVAT